MDAAGIGAVRVDRQMVARLEEGALRLRMVLRLLRRHAAVAVIHGEQHLAHLTCQRGVEVGMFQRGVGA